MSFSTNKEICEDKIKSFVIFFKSFIAFARFNAAYLALLSVITGLGQGVGLFMLIPVIRLLSDECWKHNQDK